MELNLQISANRNSVVSLRCTFINLDEGVDILHRQAGPAIRLIPEVMPTFVGATYEGTYKSAAEIDQSKDGDRFYWSSKLC